jgi:hypothetical protein
MASLYADENFDYPAVQELRQLGHDVLTAHEAGQSGQRISDTAVLAFATAQSRALLTFNRRHFIRLHRLSTSHSGIIVCTRDNDSTALSRRIHGALVNFASLDGQLVRITRPPRHGP